MSSTASLDQAAATPHRPAGRGAAVAWAGPDALVEQEECEKGVVSRPSSQAPRHTPQPDAPLTALWRGIVAVFHGTLLVALLLFLVSYVAGPWAGFTGQARRLAKVTIVAASLLEVDAPADGRFVGLRPLTNGIPVDREEVLGTVEDTQAAEKLAAVRKAVRSLQQRQLLLDDQRGQLGGTDLHAMSALEREMRETAFRILELENEMNRLRKLQDRLTLRSPVSGRIHFGLTGSMPVKAHQTVAFIWPDDGKLLVEVEAPLEVINDLISTNRVEATFATPGGEATVLATPLAASTKTFTAEPNGRKPRELWGLLQCTPVSIPESVRHPGPMGRLR